MTIATIADLEAALAKSRFKPTEASRLIGYARVSTEDQSLGMQIDALIRAGVDEADIFQEHVSGVAKRRPRLAAARKALRPGDTLVVWRLDRLGRSLRDLLDQLEWMAAHGIGFKSITEAFDTTTPIGQLYVHLSAAFAQFERQLISQRTTAGIRKRMADGQRFGREVEIDLERAERLLRQGKSCREVAVACKVSATTVYNHFPADQQEKLRKLGPKRK